MADEIVKAPNPILRQKSKVIEEITPEIREIAEEMVNFMDSHVGDDAKPLGLSACQLGHLVRMMAFRRSPSSVSRDDIQVLVNPVLVYAKGVYIVRESCSCLPGKSYRLRRSKTAKIRGLALNGTTRSYRGRDLLGQIFQHELNHLDGIMIDQIGKLVKEV